MGVRRLIAVAVLLLISSAALLASDLRQIGMVNIPGAPGFGQLAFAGGMLVVPHPGASSIDIFDPVRRRVVARVSGVESPRGVAVDEQGGKIYVADHAANSIAIIGMDGWKLGDRISLPGPPDNLLLSGNKLYWTDADNNMVSVVDVGTRENIGQVAVGGTPRRMALDSDRNLVFVSLQDSHQVVAIDPQLKIVNRFTLQASQPTGLAYDARSHELFVAVRFAVLAISPETGAEIDRVPAPAGVDTLWLDPGSRTLFAASDGTLQLIHADGRLTLGEEIGIDVKGHTVAYDAAKKMVLLPGGREGKSKVLILRPMNSSQPQQDLGETQAEVQ